MHRSVFILVSVFLLSLPIVHIRLRTDHDVTWTNLVNASVNGTVLQKTNGCDGCDDAGAASQQELTAGDGYVEFTIGEAETFWLAGLSHGNEGTSYAEIDFAFRFNGAGYADVLENGVYQPGGDTTYDAGDVFRIAVVGGRVQYSKNGLYLRESDERPSVPASAGRRARESRARPCTMRGWA